MFEVLSSPRFLYIFWWHSTHHKYTICIACTSLRLRGEGWGVESGKFPLGEDNWERKASLYVGWNLLGWQTISMEISQIDNYISYYVCCSQVLTTAPFWCFIPNFFLMISVVYNFINVTVEISLQQQEQLLLTHLYICIILCCYWFVRDRFYYRLCCCFIYMKYIVKIQLSFCIRSTRWIYRLS